MRIGSLFALAAALGVGVSLRPSNSTKMCSKCLKPFNNRGAYCKECFEASKQPTELCAICQLGQAKEVKRGLDETGQMRYEYHCDTCNDSYITVHPKNET